MPPDQEVINNKRWGMVDFKMVRVTSPFLTLHLQVFDILPLHGVIEPGESQTLQFSYYGHEDSNHSGNSSFIIMVT